MTSKLILISLLWGAVGGFLALHAFANLFAAGFCLHGLLLTRWKRLAKKAASGLVKYGINLKLLFKVGCYAFLFSLALQWGDDFVQDKYRFVYLGAPLAVAGSAAAAVVAVSARRMWRRLVVIWKMSHQFDFAERRQRTQMLKR